MSDLEQREGQAFELRLTDLLRGYASAADLEFEAFEIARSAALGTPRRNVWMPARAWGLLVFVGLLLVLIAGALVIGRPSPVLPRRVAPDEILVTLPGPNAYDRTIAVSAQNGDQHVIADDAVLALSPDRTRIVTAGPRGGRLTRLTIRTADGTEVAHTDLAAAGVAWSPDGRRLLISLVPAIIQGEPYQPGAARYALWDIESGSVTTLPFAPYARRDDINPHWMAERLGTRNWAPSGQLMLLPTDEGLIIASTDGAQVGRIPGTSRESNGYWSPSGDRIIYENREQGFIALVSVGPDLSTEVLETLTTKSPRFPSWSADGSQLAFISDDGLVVADADDLAHPRVLYGGGVRDFYPRWSSDGTRIAFLALAQFGETRYLGTGLYVVGVAGADAVQLLTHPLRGGGVQGFDW